MLRTKKEKAAVLGVIFAVLISSAIISTYILMKNSVKNLIVSNIDEIAYHDMQRIQGYVSEQLDSLLGIFNEIVYEDPETPEDIMHILRTELETNNFAKIGLMADDGSIYTGKLGIIPPENNTFLEYFNGKYGEKFAGRYDGQEFNDDQVMKYLIYGIDFYDKPIEIAGVKFTGIAALNYISEMQEKMKISLFGGKGYSSVINSEGFYIVAPDSASNPKDLPNFFEMIENRKFSKGFDIDTVKQNVLDGKSFVFSTVDSSGTERFISIRPMQDSDWFFINSVDTYVFKSHTNVFVEITFGIMMSLIVLLAGSVCLFYLFEKRLEKLYTTAVDGVFNRKYYNEKLKEQSFKSFIMLDLDHLKQINDGSGHHAGDLAIASAAEIIHNRIGSFGEVVRYGGDEFAVVYKKEVSKDEFIGQINSIIKDIRAKKLEEFPDISLSLSIGGYYGEGTSEELMSFADELLYEAKKSRNCAVTNIK